MNRWLCVLLLALSSFSLVARQGPWFPPVFEFQPRVDLLYQQYHTIPAGGGTLRVPHNDFFFDCSMGLTPYPNWNGEVALQFAHTKNQDAALDHWSVTGRYLILDDVIGDPVSLSIGFTATHALAAALHDVSSFHHGNLELEAHLSLGIESVCEQFWASRIWGVAAVGMANRGEPWLRFDLNWEKNWYDTQKLSFFLDSLWGLGNRPLKSTSSFPGYGSIAHRSIDVGVSYTRQFANQGELSVAFARRLLARNFPRSVNRLTVSFCYPFSL